MPEENKHSTDNAAYIVAACNAVPELIARVRGLEAENADLKERIKAADLAIAGLLRERRGEIEED